MGEKKPTVSVIIPTYNRANWVARSIQSVLNQTFQDFEIIIVDDASADSTAEVINSFGDPRIRYIRHEQNRGGAAARNTGIRMARGKYIAFQDSDDEWLPEKLSKQIKVIESVPARVGVVYTDMWRIHKGKRKNLRSPIIRPEDGIIYKQSLDRIKGIGIQTTLIKRECFNVVGMFDESFPRFIDLEFFFRLSKYYYFYKINEPLVNYYDIGEGISFNDEAIIIANELLFKKHYFDIAKNKRSLAKHQYWIGNILCQRGKLNQGRYYLFRAVKSYPLNIKNIAAAFVSLFGEGAYNRVARLKRRIRPVEGSYKADL